MLCLKFNVLNVTELKNEITKYKLAKECYEKFIKVVESKKTSIGKKQPEILTLHNKKKIGEMLKKRQHNEITEKTKH